MTVEAYNSVYKGNSKSVNLIWRIGADCSDASSVMIEGPTTIFSNPVLQMTDGTGATSTIDYTRSYLDNSSEMEIMYQVRTNVSYS